MELDRQMRRENLPGQTKGERKADNPATTKQKNCGNDLGEVVWQKMRGLNDGQLQ